jgi:tetratricopeptide (TPR) repeat protein
MDSTVAKSPASMPGSEAARIRTLVRQQKFSETLAAGEALLAVVPDHRDVLLYVAIAQRYLGRIPGALRTLAALEQRHPRFSRLHEERGRCFVDMKQAPQAIEAFLRAVNINPALPASWRMLDGLYRMTGQAENAAMAASHVATLQNLPPEVMTATGLFADGDLDAAEPLVRAYLLKHGNHVEGMRLLARIGIARGVLDDAELLLEAVLELAPGYRVARQEYAEVLIDLHKYSQARRELDRLLAEDPKNRLLKTLYATSSVGLGDHERAIGLYRELLRGTPEDADLHLSIAGVRRPSIPIVGRQPVGRLSGMRIGVSPISRPIDSRMKS